MALAKCPHVREQVTSEPSRQAKGQTVALLFQMLPPDLQAVLEKVRALGLKPFCFSPTSKAQNQPGSQKTVCHVHTVAFVHNLVVKKPFGIRQGSLP